MLRRTENWQTDSKLYTRKATWDFQLHAHASVDIETVHNWQSSPLLIAPIWNTIHLATLLSMPIFIMCSAWWAAKVDKSRKNAEKRHATRVQGYSRSSNLVSINLKKTGFD